jgi:crotonobetainyl-CoA:carnitine CoA-transferase CaiB-like acyl-CoA transferase
MLAELGADVIKIEPIEGGDYTRWLPPIGQKMSGAFAALNRNKRSLALNLKHSTGIDIIKRLVQHTDVLLEGFRPGVMQRLGLDYESLKSICPTLIYCAISGYGQDGPLAHRAGHDINYLARSGILSLLGHANGPPQIPAIQIADITGGTWSALSHILLALFWRTRTNKGCFCDVSICEGLLPFLTLDLGQVAVGAELPRRGSGVLGGGVPCYGVYRCADDRYLAIGALEPKFWQALVQALELPHLLDSAMSTGQDAEKVRTALEHKFLSKTRDQWLELFANLDLCVEPVLDIDELPADPHFSARTCFKLFSHATEGDLLLPNSPFRLSNIAAAPENDAPLLGQHSRDILKEYGWHDGEIESLCHSGIVLTHPETIM